MSAVPMPNGPLGARAPRAATSRALMPLSLCDVSVQRGPSLLLDAVSVRFQPGSRTLIVGPNGAGKSVLLRVCHGLMRPTAGSVHWATHDRERIRAGQAMVFQRPVLLRRSVIANLTYALSVRGLGSGWRERRSLALEALSEVGLEDLALRPARVLSGGEQQRLALARAWVLRPAVLFLDEPTASLDPGATQTVESIIESIHCSGTALIMATHDFGQARRLADQVLFIHRGRLRAHGPGARFFERPGDELAERFLAGELIH